MRATPDEASVQALYEPDQPWILRRARWSDHQTLVRWLEQDTTTELFALSWLEKHGLQPSSDALPFQWWLAVEPGSAFVGLRPRMYGACLVLARRMIVPCATRSSIGRDFGRHLAPQSMDLEHIMGQAEAVHGFWESYQGATKPRLIRDQCMYKLTRNALLSHGEAPLRLARSEDLEPVVQASAAMYREETLSDPYHKRPGAFRVMHHRRILEQRTWVWTRDNGSVLFKAEVSCSSSYGVQIAGVYTDPACRRQGIAKRGLSVMCAQLLTRYPQVTLYVNDFNHPARRVYEALGFVEQRRYASVYVT